MFVYKKDEFRVPIKIWMSKEEYFADGKLVEQLENVAKHPFISKQVVLSPDGHPGYGCPIGTVAAFKGAVSVNLVGVDIGCGMAAVKTSLTELSVDRLKEIMSLIRKKVPVGFNKHKEAQDGMPNVIAVENHDSFNCSNPEFSSYPEETICSQEYKNASKQLGTLGGGNHFIEIQKGSDGHIWFMVHSGSRNLGYTVAKHYNKLAEELNEKWKSVVPKDHGLAFLPLDTKEAKQYLAEMNYCLDFAQANRDLMVKRIKDAFTEISCKTCDGNGGKKGKKCENCYGSGLDKELTPELMGNIRFDKTISIHHNYAQMEHHFGSNVMVHRKGATSAKEGELGIIPGSQGTSSYIVKGKGNPESFKSCSHGAGRTMSRTKAIKTLDFDAEVKAMEDKGIIHSVRGKKQLDESPSSYKDIDLVMEEQKDLVDIVVKLEPMGCIKG